MSFVLDSFINRRSLSGDVLLPIQHSSMKLPLVLFLTALASRQIQAWERSAIDSRKPGASLHTSYTGTLHEPDENGEDRCVGTFGGTNFFEHNCRNLSEDCWISFAQKCREILGGIIQMIANSCKSDKSHSTVDIDMKSRVVNNGKFCTEIPEKPKLHCEKHNHPIHCDQPVYSVQPVQPIQPIRTVHPVREPILVAEPEYLYPQHHHHHHHHSHPHHSHREHEKAIKMEEKLEEKKLKNAIKKLEIEEWQREIEDKQREKEMLKKEKAMDEEFVRAAVHDKEEGIELLEKQKKELEMLHEAIVKHV